ncbi:hypothetical protein NL329_30855, partial [Klebsiella pneumoniae]|nr:hypothetical protein [Klebsiella pneumoniae]
GVLHDARDYRVRFAQIEAGDPLDRMLSALDLAIGYYLADPDFYRSLWREVFSASGEVRHAIYNPKRDDFWLGLLAALEQA